MKKKWAAKFVSSSLFVVIVVVLLVGRSKECAILVCNTFVYFHTSNVVEINHAG